jgi:hypothetical protein
MKFLKNSFLITICLILSSCDNEIDLNTDYVETTSVYSLIDAFADTQYVRISRTFIEDGVSAIELAKDPDRLYYDSLKVSLVHMESGNKMNLKKMFIPKDPGFFTAQENRVYVLDSNLIVNNNYQLEIVREDNSIVKLDEPITTIRQVGLEKPSPLRPNPSIAFADNAGEYLEGKFEFNIASNIAAFQVNIYLLYDEIDGVNGTVIERKEVKVPLGLYKNDDLISRDDAVLKMAGERFFRTISNSVEITPIEKQIPPTENIRIEIFAVDPLFLFYQDLNGPIDGVAQVRPEFSNVNNGVGIVASRSNVSYLISLDDFSKLFLRDGEYTKNHNFSF